MKVQSLLTDSFELGGKTCGSVKCGEFWELPVDFSMKILLHEMDIN